MAVSNRLPPYYLEFSEHEGPLEPAQFIAMEPLPFNDEDDGDFYAPSQNLYTLVQGTYSYQELFQAVKRWYLAGQASYRAAINLNKPGICRILTKLNSQYDALFHVHPQPGDFDAAITTGNSELVDVLFLAGAFSSAHSLDNALATANEDTIIATLETMLESGIRLNESILRQVFSSLSLLHLEDYLQHLENEASRLSFETLSFAASMGDLDKLKLLCVYYLRRGNTFSNDEFQSLQTTSSNDRISHYLRTLAAQLHTSPDAAGSRPTLHAQPSKRPASTVLNLDPPPLAKRLKI